MQRDQQRIQAKSYLNLFWGSASSNALAELLFWLAWSYFFPLRSSPRSL